nr:sigma 54-interacting transcriptional regulator [uncultured Oscillibacter sp.]
MDIDKATTWEEKYAQLLVRFQELSRMYNILDQVIENSADAFWLFDQNGHCIRVNSAYERLIGMSRTELIGIHASELIGTAVSDISTNKVLERKQPVSFEQKFLKTGHSAIVTSTPVYDKEGNFVVGICNDRDMSALESLKQKLQQADKLTKEYEMKIETLKKAYIHGDSNLILVDPRSKVLLSRAMKVAHMDSTVLILGETGVGKGEIAKMIHKSSSRAEEAFVEINCGAISPELIESELFGYEKGAFTGANTGGKLGLLEVANKGTVFLDEIGELPLLMQVKLLRVLQEREIIPVGSTQQHKIDIRIIIATNRDLEEMVKCKLFREDLYYRINVFPLTVPPLRERVEDITPLANLFLKQLNRRYNYRKEFRPDVLNLLRRYEWPGNVRELKNSIEQAFINAESNIIGIEDFHFSDSNIACDTGPSFQKGPGETLADFLSRIEYRLIQDAYNTAGNVRKAAKLLNMSPATFVRKRSIYIEKAEEHSRSN